MDRTAQTEPLTTGQSIVAKWEALDSPWSEPADLAEAIDKAIAAEREACARIADALKHNGSYTIYQDYDHGYENGVCEVATRIRARST